MNRLQPSDLSTWRVLIVDDERDNLSVIQSTLEFFDIASVVAASGPEGLDRLKNDPHINILLLDIQMPLMSGFELLKVIRSSVEWGSLPAVAVTAHAMVGDRERILSAGFDGYIPKPLDPELFVDLVRAVLARSESPAATGAVAPDVNTGLGNPGEMVLMRRAGDQEATVSVPALDTTESIDVPVGAPGEPTRAGSTRIQEHVGPSPMEHVVSQDGKELPTTEPALPDSSEVSEDMASHPGRKGPGTQDGAEQVALLLPPVERTCVEDTKPVNEFGLRVDSPEGGQ